MISKYSIKLDYALTVLLEYIDCLLQFSINTRMNIAISVHCILPIMLAL